ncbi:MAG: protein TolR [Alphaproteobacteria bacterium]|nr:protein TolR [Alphaproteobacteria bacterium]
MGAKLTGRQRSRHARGMMSEINVTPMVDVMLVLLVIFMVTAPMLTAGVEVNLPKAGAKAMAQPDNAPLEISVDKKGVIFIGETKTSASALKARLEAIAAEVPDRRVYIKADDGLGYGKVMEVMAIVNTSGLTKIALVTDPARAKN